MKFMKRLTYTLSVALIVSCAAQIAEKQGVPNVAIETLLSSSTQWVDKVVAVDGFFQWNYEYRVLRQHSNAFSLTNALWLGHPKAGFEPFVKERNGRVRVVGKFKCSAKGMGYPQIWRGALTDLQSFEVLGETNAAQKLER